MDLNNTYLHIDLDAISQNYNAICKKAGKPVMAVVKADAYGHGAVQIAKLLENQCDFFGLATVFEALELRKAGIRKPMLVLGPMPESAFSLAVAQDIRPAIGRYESALALSAEAVRQGKTAAFHFAVDTGMSRIGFQVTEEDADVCAKICSLPGLFAEGLFSHFATADCNDLQRTRLQIDAFDRFNNMLKRRGIAVPLRHLDNSAGIMRFGCQYDMARAGIILYGIYPSEELDPCLLPLQPALRWTSHISNLQQLPAGREVGYGGTHICTRPTMVATVPVGYADGYRRNLSNRFYVLIRGKKAPILGRICMDQMMVDVTHIPDVALNDTVTLMGTDGDQRISIEEISAAADSFPYEFACAIQHRRTPRIYYQDGKIVEISHQNLDI